MSNTASKQKSQEGLFRQDFLEDEHNLSADSRQDKYSASPCNPASDQPYSSHTSALQNQKTPHFDTRQKFYAGSWVDQATDTYIQYRERQGRKLNRDYSRSKAIRDIIRERAQDEGLQANRDFITSALRETVEQEFRQFENRHIALNAKMAYQVGWILALLIKFVSFVLGGKANDMLTDSETAGRVNVTRRTPQDDEAIANYKQALAEKH